MLLPLLWHAMGQAQSALYSQGLAAYNARQWAQAAVLMTQAEANSPGVTDALLYTGKSYLQLNRLVDAEKSLAEFIRTHPTSADALYALGLAQQRENKPRESLATFTRAAKLRIPRSEELRIVGLDYVLLGEYPDAIHWLEKAVAFDGNNTEAWYSLGRCDYTQSRFNEAEKAFERVLALEPEHMKAAENLGLTYSAMNRLDDAERSFRLAVTLAKQKGSKDEWPYLDYGSFLEDQHRSQEAIPLLEQSVKLNPQCTACHEKLGRALGDAGKPQDGVRELEQAVALNKNDARLHWELGLAYRKAGMQVEARKELELSRRLYGIKATGEPK
ncbi:Flp pilus assembly protein TadD [Edaphobacter aggregans]|uniref:Flp pilus assembly protein TadD n=1 Tax=Edaphobacter aggregans TaxID=570835 RepID=A0A428MQH9_9BACT|nr:tetratricopeptide repeat protein [Edaphobacter aggregans]RSL19135.1 Flp pilus assembly protein TadD [Edaphobacter aggregans]